MSKKWTKVDIDDIYKYSRGRRRTGGDWLSLEDVGRHGEWTKLSMKLETAHL